MATRQLWDAPRATAPAEYVVKLPNDIPEGPQQPRAKETATRGSATHCNSAAQLQRQGIDCCAVAVDAGGAPDVLDDTYGIPPHNYQPDARSASEIRLLQPRTYIVRSAILGAINGVRYDAGDPSEATGAKQTGIAGRSQVHRSQRSSPARALGAQT